MNDELNGGTEGQQTEDMEFTVNEWENNPVYNLLPKGLYEFKVFDANQRIAKSWNDCIVVVLNVQGKRIQDWLIRCDMEGKRHQMTYKFHNFLFAIGIRNTNKKFTVSKSQMVGKTGLCDVKLNKEGTDNAIDNYSPVEESVAPMKDVPPENISEPLIETTPAPEMKEKLAKKDKPETSTEDL